MGCYCWKIDICINYTIFIVVGLFFLRVLRERIFRGIIFLLEGGFALMGSGDSNLIFEYLVLGRFGFLLLFLFFFESIVVLDALAFFIFLGFLIFF